MTLLINCPSSTTIAVLLAPLPYRSLKSANTRVTLEKHCFDAQVILSEEVWQEIWWWIENLVLSKGRAIIGHWESSIGHSFRCLSSRLVGSSLPGLKDERSMDSGGTERSHKHKYTGDKGSQISFFDIYPYASTGKVN